MRKAHIAAFILALGLSAPSCQSPSSTDIATPSGVPQRVVSLIPSATELIYEVGAESTLVGVTLNDNHPPEVQALPKVGDQTIDTEKLLSLKPDLVVLDTEFNTELSKYRRLGLPVLALESRRLSDIGENLRLLGSKLGHTESGEAAASRFEQALHNLPKLDSSQAVFIEIWGSPLMTVGADSLPNDLLTQIGLKNVYSDQKGYFQVDAEDVLSRKPSIIILPSGSPKETSKAAELLSRAGVRTKVITLDGDLFTNPSPRILDGLKILLDELGETSP